MVKQSVTVMHGGTSLTLERCLSPEWAGVAWVLHPAFVRAPLGEARDAACLAHRGGTIDLAGDHFNAACILWEKLTNRKLPEVQNPGGPVKWDVALLFVQNGKIGVPFSGVWSQITEICSLIGEVCR